MDYDNVPHEWDPEVLSELTHTSTDSWQFSVFFRLSLWMDARNPIEFFPQLLWIKFNPWKETEWLRELGILYSRIPRITMVKGAPNIMTMQTGDFQLSFASRLLQTELSSACRLFIWISTRALPPQLVHSWSAFSR